MLERRRVLAGLVLVLVAVSCGSDSQTTTPTTSAPPTAPQPSAPPSSTTTTGPATTSEPLTTSAATTTLPPIGDTCDVVVGGSSAPAANNEAALDRFGPLEPAPSLTIDFGPDPVTDRRGVRATRIEGGVLVSSGRSSTVLSGPQDKLPIAAVQHDGAVRWSRCIVGHSEIQTAVAAPQHHPANALVMVLGENAPNYRSHFVQLSLATGADVATFATAMESVGVDADQLGRLGIADVTDRFVLLADNVSVFGGDYAHLVRYDLVADVAVDVGVPPALLTGPSLAPCNGGLRPALLSTGDVVVENITTDTVATAPGSVGTGSIAARWHDGRWSDDVAPIIDVVGVRPGFSCDDNLSGRVLRGVDASGQVRWTNSQLTHPGADDIGWYVDGDIAVGQVCSQRTGDDCDQLDLVGVDVRDGVVRWTQPGLRVVAGDPSDGYVLAWAEVVGDVLEPSGWVLLDDRTGGEVEDQRWADPDEFTAHPSREVDGFNRTVRAGGIVLVVDDGQVRVWYPNGTAADPHSTLLP